MKIEAFRLGVVCRGETLWDGLDFSFDSGSVSLVVAPPSSGKTVLLSILRGERKPDAGDVLVSGESLYRGSSAAARAFRASCGHVSERQGEAARLVVADLFRRSALACRGLSGRERRERENRLLEMVGLPGSGTWTLASLSVSERARVYLAAELLGGPKVLFADGVVGAAGGPHREKLAALFRALAREGNTIVLGERLIPERWAAAAEETIPAEPFRVFRLPVPPQGSGSVPAERAGAGDPAADGSSA